MKRIEVGDKVPHFRLYNQEEKIIDITNYLGKPMIIYFYPKNNTPGCTKEACAFRDEYHRFSKAGITVFGISTDSVESHKKFKTKYRLPFDLLSDKNNQVRKAFGVPSDLFGLIPGRVTYIIDAKGVVRHLIDNQMNIGKHIEESLRSLRTLNSQR